MRDHTAIVLEHNGRVIKVIGPFTDEASAKAYADARLNEWFDKGYVIIPMIEPK